MNGCPELEALVLAQSEHDPDALAHLRSCPDCAAQVEEHRQLEKDLFRLVDPLPPADLVVPGDGPGGRSSRRPVRVELKTAVSASSR